MAAPVVDSEDVLVAVLNPSDLLQVSFYCFAVVDDVSLLISLLSS